MSIISSRKFHQQTGAAKKMSERGPVFIMDRGKPSHVLLTVGDYQRLAGQKNNLADLLAMPGIEDVELVIPRFGEHGTAADVE